jgi:RNA polymerase-associated protein RTF1
MTDSDITAMLKKKKEMSATQSSSDLVLEKQGLHQARSLALKRQDYKEASEIADKIAELELRIHGPSNGATPKKAVDDKDEILRRVNERNRKANQDAVRRAEIAESERKRREREATAKAAATGGAAAVAAVVAKFDPSARLKTMPRLFNAATPGTRYVLVTSRTCM